MYYTIWKFAINTAHFVVKKNHTVNGPVFFIPPQFRRETVIDRLQCSYGGSRDHLDLQHAVVQNIGDAVCQRYSSGGAQINKNINQFANQSINQSTTQSINQAVSQLVK